MTQLSIQNPILPGFNPDPSICRVGDDYYIATSTFEWFPGVQIHHSRNLIDWELVSRPLSRLSQLDMKGCPDSCGIWAPCLTHADGKFHLIYTNVRRFDGNFKDAPNYLVTCDSIDGEWSEPIYLNSSGFDPSLFHDDDGKKYLVNMLWDHRHERNRFGGILLQEYSPEQKKLVGPIHNIFKGTELALTEGPHLYKLNGYYYLLTAEGGTGYTHAMTFARSKNITGPYEIAPQPHMVTAKDAPENLLQRTGHGDIVQTPDGEWYAVQLCGRPMDLHGGKAHACPMGRETSIQKIELREDGWFYLANGTTLGDMQVPAPKSATASQPREYERRNFDTTELPKEFQWLRIADPSVFMNIDTQAKKLRLIGKESLGSLYTSALIARRQEHFKYQASTCVDFNPLHFQQMAGLVCYYNSHKFHYLYISTDEELGRHLGIMSCEGDQTLTATFPIENERITLADGPVHMRADVDFDSLYFSWSQDGENWNRIERALDQSIITDEAGKGEGANFTGAFVGMCCQDISGTDLPADFDYFDYQPK